MREILPYCSWGPGFDNLAQKGLNLSHLWHHPQKPGTSKKCLLGARRHAKSFEGLISSPAQLTDQLWSCKDLANMGKSYLLMQNSPSLWFFRQCFWKGIQFDFVVLDFWQSRCLYTGFGQYSNVVLYVMLSQCCNALYWSNHKAVICKPCLLCICGGFSKFMYQWLYGNSRSCHCTLSHLLLPLVTGCLIHFQYIVSLGCWRVLCTREMQSFDISKANFSIEFINVFFPPRTVALNQGVPIDFQWSTSSYMLYNMKRFWMGKCSIQFISLNSRGLETKTIT